MLKAGATMRAAAMKAALLGVCVMLPSVQAFIQLAPSQTNAGIARPTLSMPLRKVGDGGGIVSLTSLLGLQTLRKRARRLQLHATVLSTETLNKKPAKSSMVFLLITLNMLVFVLDKFSPVYMQGLYLNHRTPQLHQFVSSALCHANAQHLSSNMFPLLVFGKSVEEELGATGLLFCYVSCAVLSNIASILFLPAYSLGLGASGVVFGLFIIAVGRSTVEAAIFGQYVWEKLKMEVAVTASGGIAGVNHAAHLGGAAAGLAIVLFIRVLLGIFETSESSSSARQL